MADGPTTYDDVDIDDDLVRRLVATQLPGLAHLPLVALPRTGTDNAVYRLGEELAVRLPRRAGAEVQMTRDEEVLAVVADVVPCALPRQVELGRPGEGFPYHWSVVRWIPGEVPDPGALADPVRLADDLAAVVRGLRSLEPIDGFGPSVANFGRGCPLHWRDQPTRDAIDSLGDLLDVAAAHRTWEAALEVGEAPDPRWSHADLHPWNVVVDGAGGLAGIIDWAAAGIGDASGDLLPAWLLLGPHERARYLDALEADDAERARGRGWMLSVGAIYVAGYRTEAPMALDSWIQGTRAAIHDG